MKRLPILCCLALVATIARLPVATSAAEKTDVLLAMDSDAIDKRTKIAQKLKSYGINVKYLDLVKDISSK